MPNYRIIYTKNTSPVFEEPDPIKPRSTTHNILRWSFALLFLVAMVYLYGAQQFVQFHRTPAGSTAGEYQSLVAGEEVRIPTTIFVISSGSDFNQGRVEGLVTQANQILWQANVSLESDEVRLIMAPDDYSVGPELVSNPTSLQELLPPLVEDRLHVVVVSGLGGLNGVAFPGRQVVAVAEYTTSFDFRVLAHEVGHALSLTHVNDKANLMYSGSSGTTLTKVQAKEANKKAQDFLPSE